MLRMPSFQLCLPEVMVSVDESGGDDLALAIDHLDGLVRRYCYVAADFRDSIIVDEHIRVNKGDDVVVLIMREDRPSTKQDRTSSHRRRFFAYLTCSMF